MLERFNGQEKFDFDKGTISVHKDDGWVSFVFNVDADGIAVKSLPDTFVLYASPLAEAIVIVDNIDLDLLIDNTFSIDSSYDEQLEEYLSNFCYVEHLDFDNIKIKVKHIKSNIFSVDWSGTTMDVNYYDGSKPDTRISISGEFVFERMDEWE